jgi:tetratricopeptide (TPR) repeat protein
LAHEGTNKTLYYLEPNGRTRYELTALSPGWYVLAASKNQPGPAQVRLDMTLRAGEAPPARDRNTLVQHWVAGLQFDRQSRATADPAQAKQYAEQAVQEFTAALALYEEADVRKRLNFAQHCLQVIQYEEQALAARQRNQLPEALNYTRQAIEEVKQAGDLEPHNAAVKQRLAKLLEWEQILKKLLATAPPKQKESPEVEQRGDPEVERLIDEAIQAYNAKNYVPAERLLQQALEREPDNARAEDLLDMVHLAQQQAR